MYQCVNFKIHEIVPPRILKQRGEWAWELLDTRLLVTLDRLQIRYGKTTVNNYHWGGNREWSGLRTPDSPYYSKTSQHTFGRAADCLFDRISAEEVRQDILKNREQETFQFIMSIELNTSWLHFDVRNCSRIKTYTP